MRKPLRKSGWAKAFERSFATATKAAARAFDNALKPVAARRAPPKGDGTWIAGVSFGSTGARRFRLYRPPDVRIGERLPLMVMLHGCGQDANAFAVSTRMNRIAMRERFLVLYPEQDRLANGQGCWNWFDTSTGRAYGESALIMKAIDQVCLLHRADRGRVAVAGLSAGASMAALLVTRHPGRFKAVVMHSGIPPGTAHSGLSALGAMHGRRPTLPLATTPVMMEACWPPLLVIHGAADHVVSPHNGFVAAQTWAAAAGARAQPVRNVQRGKRYPMSVTDFMRRGNTVATLVQVDRLAHAWSGGAGNKPFSDDQGPDASRMAWSFAAKQFHIKATRRDNASAPPTSRLPQR
jgi:poly(hydroxyalkanoate) depolymerase family esterase